MSNILFYHHNNNNHNNNLLSDLFLFCFVSTSSHRFYLIYLNCTCFVSHIRSTPLVVLLTAGFVFKGALCSFLTRRERSSP